MTYRIIPATEPHIREIARNIRKADADEIMAASGMDPLSGLLYSADNSYEAWVAGEPGHAPVCIFGIGDAAGIAAPWMLGTDGMLKYRKELIRDARVWIERWTNHYGFIGNIVDARNTTHVRWLRHMGFQMMQPKLGIGHDPDVPFIPFYRSS